MKKLITTFMILALLLSGTQIGSQGGTGFGSVSPQAAGTGVMHVYLLIGQSNMVGLGGSPVAADLVDNPRIKKVNPDLQLVSGIEPSNMDNGNNAGRGSCARALAETILPTLPAEDSIVLINSAWGGTSVEQWAKVRQARLGTTSFQA